MLKFKRRPDSTVCPSYRPSNSWRGRGVKGRLDATTEVSNLAVQINAHHICRRHFPQRLCQTLAEYLHETEEALFKTYSVCSYIIHWKGVSVLSFFPLILSCHSSFPRRSLMWEAAPGTQPCHINMRNGETFPLCYGL